MENGRKPDVRLLEVRDLHVSVDDNEILKGLDLAVNLGDAETALAMLGPYCSRTGREQLEWLKSDPDLDALRPDARFQAIVEQAERRLASIQP